MRRSRYTPRDNRRCLNPACGKSLEGKKPHAKTCSPACRKALWRYAPTPKFMKPAKPSRGKKANPPHVGTSRGRR